MEKTMKIKSILTLAVAFCFVLVSLAEAVTKKWANNNLENKNRAVSIPIWKITQDGKAISVKWVDHAPNPRFAIYDPGTPADETDDIVLDKETGLVWARDADLAGVTRTWEDAISNCHVYIWLGNRRGWRLPTVEELSSLVDPIQKFPALPVGHPFVNVQSSIYWSSTTYEADTAYAWTVHMGPSYVVKHLKTFSYHVWPVRGGNGYATGNW